MNVNQSLIDLNSKKMGGSLQATQPWFTQLVEDQVKLPCKHSIVEISQQIF